jgi:hypothetical protein
MFVSIGTLRKETRSKYATIISELIEKSHNIGKQCTSLKN